MVYHYRYPTINGSHKRLNTVTPTVSPTVTPAVTHTMTPPVPSRARHAQYTRGIAMPAAGPDPPPAQHAARLVICTICTGACRRVMLGSAGTFTLSRQREFTQREFHTARVSRSAGTVARCTTAQRTARVDTDTSPVGATGAATRRSHRRAQKTCAHAEGGTEGGTWSCRRRAGLPDCTLRSSLRSSRAVRVLWSCGCVICAVWRHQCQPLRQPL